MSEQKNLGYLGYSFQLKVLSQMLNDKAFAENIIPILDPAYFDDANCRLISKLLREYHTRYNTVPSYEVLDNIVRIEIKTEVQCKYVLDVVAEIRNQELLDVEWIQERAFKFCKQQELKKAIQKAEVILEQGDFERYDEIEEYIKKALSFGMDKDVAINVFSNLENVMVDDYRDTIPTGIEGLDSLFKGGVAKGEILVLLAPMGVGKALPNSEKILTPRGWKLMGDIKIGDEVIGKDGNIQIVLGVYPQGERDIFIVEFNDGTSVRCDGEHLWAVNSLNQRSLKTKKGGKVIKTPDYSYLPLTTLEISENLVKRNQLNYCIPIVKPINFKTQKVNIDPYVMGALLGNGYMKSGRISTKDQEIIDGVCTKYLNSNVKQRVRKNGQIINVIQLLKFKDELLELDLLDKKSDTKFIPDCYLFNNLANRIRLLQGLLDTDGYCGKSGRVQFSTVSKQLHENVRELVLSLGGFCGVKTKQPYYTYNGVKKMGKLSYILTISFPHDDFNLFTIKRKQERVMCRKKYSMSKFIKSVYPFKREEATCILVSNDDHLFITNDYVVTHNTTFLTKVANSAFNAGANVLQIFFEDNVSEIQRKHICCWTGVPLTEMNQEMAKDAMIKKQLSELQAKPNQLLLQRWQSDSMTITQIKSHVRKLKSDGINIDMIVIDYIDCVIPERGTDDVYNDEGKIMRKFEAMCHELNLVGVTATQGNRSSISSDVVTNDQMGGSIKKAQIGHIVISIAKTLSQKENGLATMAILKSRVSKDGLVFENCIFNNERMEISTEQSETFLGFETNKSDRQKKRAIDLYKERKGLMATNNPIPAVAPNLTDNAQ